MLLSCFHLYTMEKLVHRKQDAGSQLSTVERLSHEVGEVRGFLSWDNFLFWSGNIKDI